MLKVLQKGYPLLKEMIEEREVKQELAILLNKSIEELDSILNGTSDNDFNIVEFNLICLFLGITPDDALQDFR